MDQKLRLEFLKGLDPGAVDRIQAGVEGSLSDAGMSRTTRFMASTVVEELCTNIMEHSGADWLEVALTSHEGHVKLTIRDNGKPFDQAEAVRSATPAELKDRVDRKLGLYMVQRLTERLHWSRGQDGFNLVEFEIGQDLELAGALEQTLRLDPLKGLDPEDLDRILEGVENILADSGLERSTRFITATLVEELCTNIMTHSGAAWLEVALASAAGKARVRVRDNGKPFDTAQAAVAAPPAELRDKLGQSLGLYMVAQMAKRLRWGRDHEGCNLVEFEVTQELDQTVPDSVA